MRLEKSRRLVTPFLHSVVRPEVELVMPANCRSSYGRTYFLLSHSRSFARDELRNPFASFEFPVVIPRGSHPFPSRTRKLSLAGPMILHGQLCGNVGHRLAKEKGATLEVPIVRTAKRASPGRVGDSHESFGKSTIDPGKSGD